MEIVIRKIVEIDEERCDGCGLCATACAEGAIRIIDGKARLVSDSYCDGLGACLGECPQDAITIIEREADEFDEEEAERHLAGLSAQGRGNDPRHGESEDTLPCGCPGSMARELPASGDTLHAEGGAATRRMPSHLRNWPVQLHLVPVNAPYLEGARLLIAADCVPFALADFHTRLLDGKILLIGCPKLDDAATYCDKLAAMLSNNDIREVTVAFMEVPCCFGLVNLVKQAIAESGKSIPFNTTKVGIEGDILEKEEQPSPLPA